MDPHLKHEQKPKPSLRRTESRTDTGSAVGSATHSQSAQMSDSSSVTVNKTVIASENTSPLPLTPTPTPPLVSSSTSNQKNDSDATNEFQLQRSTSTQKSVCFHSLTGQPGASRKITNGQFTFLFCLCFLLNPERKFALGMKKIEKLVKFGRYCVLSVNNNCEHT